MPQDQTAEKLKRWGWVDPSGRSVTWFYWHKFWQAQKRGGLPTVVDRTPQNTR